MLDKLEIKIYPTDKVRLLMILWCFYGKSKDKYKLITLGAHDKCVLDATKPL